MKNSIFVHPVKTPTYGTLVGLLNAKNPELGKRIVEKLSGTLQEAFDHVDPYKVFCRQKNFFK